MGWCNCHVCCLAQVGRRMTMNQVLTRGPTVCMGRGCIALSMATLKNPNPRRRAWWAWIGIFRETLWILEASTATRGFWEEVSGTLVEETPNRTMLKSTTPSPEPYTKYLSYWSTERHNSKANPKIREFRGFGGTQELRIVGSAFKSQYDWPGNSCKAWSS